jgi:hypothetical protein
MVQSEICNEFLLLWLIILAAKHTHFYICKEEYEFKIQLRIHKLCHVSRLKAAFLNQIWT